MDNKESGEGFVHSIKVPKTYRDVAKIIKKVIEDGSGLKCSVYNNNTDFNRNNQRNLALASKILNYFPQIEHAIRTTQILLKETRLDPWLARVLIYELLWHKELTHPSKPIQTIVSYKKELQDALKTFKEDNNTPTKKVIRPRYARVNTFKKDLSDVIAQLRDEGMILLPSFQETYNEYLDTVKTLQQNQMMLDYHIKEMLVFSPNFCFARHEFFKNSVLIFQDKASCLAPMLLNPPEGSVVLDMCAAPGMKTNYLANLVGKNGFVYAVEKCEHRFLTMSKLIENQGLKNVKCMLEDATKLNGDQLADVEYILVDPSCSGSGIVNRVDHTEQAPGRLKSLAYFQSRILRFALTKFPKVKRVVYSTCSIHPEENEEVVSNVLQSTDNFKLVNLQTKMQPNWNNFGSEAYGTIGTSCLYANPEKDLTNGFFVAVFKRIKEDSNKRKRFEETNIDYNSTKDNENTEHLVHLNEQQETENIPIKRKRVRSKIMPKQKRVPSNIVILTENTNEENPKEKVEQTEISEQDNVNNQENESTEEPKVKTTRRGKKSRARAKKLHIQRQRARKKLEQNAQKSTEMNSNEVQNKNDSQTNEDNSNNDTNKTNIVEDNLNDVNHSVTNEASEEPKKKKRSHRGYRDKSKKRKEYDFAEMFL